MVYNFSRKSPSQKNNLESSYPCVRREMKSLPKPIFFHPLLTHLCSCTILQLWRKLLDLWQQWMSLKNAFLVLSCQYVLSSLSQVDLFHLGTTIWFLLQPANFLPSFQFAERFRAEGMIWRVPLTLLAFGTEIFCAYPQNVEDLATWKMTIMSIVEHYAEKAEKLVRILGKLPSNCLFIRLYFLHQCIKSWNIFPFLQ